MATSNNAIVTQDVQLINQPGKGMELKRYAESKEIVGAFARVLGSEPAARNYIGSVMISVYSKPGLQVCSAKSIMTEAMRSAVLGLSVDPALHQAHLVPYKGEAKLIPDYHGLVELMDRTGLYDVINVVEFWEGEKVITDRLTGKVTFEGDPILDAKGLKIVAGWVAYFKMKSGREYYLAMTNAECEAHGKKYNPSGYASAGGVWEKEKPKMHRKTVLRCLANKWAIYSPYVTAALKGDDAIIESAIVLPDENEVTPATRFQQSSAKDMSDLGFGDERTEREKILEAENFREWLLEASRADIESALRKGLSPDQAVDAKDELSHRPAETAPLFKYSHANIVSAVAQAWDEAPGKVAVALHGMHAAGAIPAEMTVDFARGIQRPGLTIEDIPA